MSTTEQVAVYFTLAVIILWLLRNSRSRSDRVWLIISSLIYIGAIAVSLEYVDRKASGKGELLIHILLESFAYALVLIFGRKAERRHAEVGSAEKDELPSAPPQ
jgi:hypothetical protein